MLFILSTALVLSFTGCGKKDEKSSSIPQSSSATQESSKKSDAKTSDKKDDAKVDDKSSNKEDTKAVTDATIKTKIAAAIKIFDEGVSKIKGATAGTEEAKKATKEKLAKIKADFPVQSAEMKKLSTSSGISAKSKQACLDLQKAFDNTVKNVVDPYTTMINANETKKLSSIIPKLEEAIKLSIKALKQE